MVGSVDDGDERCTGVDGQVDIDPVPPGLGRRRCGLPDIFQGLDDEALNRLRGGGGAARHDGLDEEDSMDSFTDCVEGDNAWTCSRRRCTRRNACADIFSNVDCFQKLNLIQSEGDEND